ncbi:PCC domain-containing protein [Embleya hyalina]|uniref:PPC domain-containing protein n=1 Tax=Embleya hyalina TaxID=516124 RepID=A0A401Z5W6_9ACTN|nr:hypothetical protein EHYA_09985 [Embleya hyalina]
MDGSEHAAPAQARPESGQDGAHAATRAVRWFVRLAKEVLSPMRFTQVSVGRTFGIALDEGEDFLPQLVAFCTEHGIRAGYLPMFLGGLRHVRLVGTCERMDNPDAPVWSAAEYELVEALGCGTIAWGRRSEHRRAPHPRGRGPEGPSRRRQDQPPPRRNRPVHPRTAARRSPRTRHDTPQARPPTECRHCNSAHRAPPHRSALVCGGPGDGFPRPTDTTASKLVIANTTLRGPGSTQPPQRWSGTDINSH